MRVALTWVVLGTACSFTPPPEQGATVDARDGVDVPGPPPDGACTMCPPNDTAAGAVPITSSGRIAASLAGARDDVTASCGANGGRDLFYELVVPARQVVYIDTVAADFDGVLSIHAGPCASSPAEVACADDPCAPASHAQLARSLAAGTHCLIVDERPGGGDSLQLDVLFAGRDGTELTGPGPWTVTGDTCTGTNRNNPSCEAQAPDPGTAKDLMYWFTVCPGSHSVSASTCSGTSYDSIVYLKSDVGELACRDDGCGGLSTGSSMTAAATGNGLMMVIVDGWNGDCGPFTLSVVL